MQSKPCHRLGLSQPIPKNSCHTVDRHRSCHSWRGFLRGHLIKLIPYSTLCVPFRVGKPSFSAGNKHPHSSYSSTSKKAVFTSLLCRVRTTTTTVDNQHTVRDSRFMQFSCMQAVLQNSGQAVKWAALWFILATTQYR